MMAEDGPLSGTVGSHVHIQVPTYPDIEEDIQRLRYQRLKERENALYIPPQGKPTLQSSDDTLFPLTEKVLEFLTGPGMVLLLLGDSGGGKSTFSLQLEHILWKEYKRGGPIPLHINLPTIDQPQQNMIIKRLHQLNFSDVHCQELRQTRQFIVICDGYDESQLKKNLYNTNLLNQPGQWTVKMVISCRSQYLGADYRARFQPTGDRYQQLAANLLQEAVIASFSRDQIQQYVEQFVQRALPQTLDAAQPSWTVEDYMDKLTRIPKLIELVSNPFLLTLALRALPKVIRSETDLSTIRLTRVELYDNFTEQWLETNKLRLVASPLSLEVQEAFDILLDEDFIQQGLNFQKNLAMAIFQHQDGVPVVEYSHFRESRTWKAPFFAPGVQTALLRDSSPLTRSSNQYRFLHRSILEYLYSRVMSDPFEPVQHATSDPSTTDRVSFKRLVDHPLNQRSIVGEPSVLEFLAERAQLEPLFKAQLLSALESSKVDEKVSQAAANAISILIRAGVRFNGADLRRIRIPGADLTGGQFDSADLEGGDLSGVNLAKAWLRQTNLRSSRMSGVQFGELPYLKHVGSVAKCVFSPDGAFLAVSTSDVRITIYDTKTWIIIATYPGGKAIAISPTTNELAKGGEENAVELGDILTGDARLVLVGHDSAVTCLSYSPDGTHIASASNDDTVRIWFTLSGNIRHVLIGHLNFVNGVAFSPTGLQVASCSDDMTVRTWNSLTGEPLHTLDTHADPVLCVAYSPDGCQLVSGDRHDTVLLWDAPTGKVIGDLPSHSGSIQSVAYSPDGRQIASCGDDAVVRLWDPHTRTSIGNLSGHRGFVTSVSYSPISGHIASGSNDKAVRLWKLGREMSDIESDNNMRGWCCIDMSPDDTCIVAGNEDGIIQLWDTRTGIPGSTLTGHTDEITGVAFSPCGVFLASSSNDSTARLWCVKTGVTLRVFEGHTEPVYDVTFSPSGRHVASVSLDGTVRTWDIQTGEVGLVLVGHDECANKVVYSPNSRQIASCGEDNTACVWCAETGEQLFVLHHPMVLRHVLFSPDNQELISVTRGDGVLRYWSLQSGKCIDLRKDHHVHSYSHLPINNLISTVGGDGMLRLWDRTSGRWLEVFLSMVGIALEVRWVRGEGGVYLVTFLRGYVRVWELTETKCTYDMRLLWSVGGNELTLAGANLCGTVGLNPIDLKLVRQQGAITMPKD